MGWGPFPRPLLLVPSPSASCLSELGTWSLEPSRKLPPGKQSPQRSLIGVSPRVPAQHRALPLKEERP